VPERLLERRHSQALDVSTVERRDGRRQARTLRGSITEVDELGLRAQTAAGLRDRLTADGGDGEQHDGARCVAEAGCVQFNVHDDLPCRMIGSTAVALHKCAHASASHDPQCHARGISRPEGRC
jgi:hypothetical protein